MWVGQDFDDLDAGAVDTFTFKFDRLLADGEALSVPQTQWTATVLEVAPGCSRDDNPQSRFVGGAQAPPGQPTWSAQVFGPGVPGNTYRLLAQEETNYGNTKSLWARVKCVTPASSGS
jgi:hypothetical protein